MTSFTKRSLLKTTLLTFCTFGLYDLYYLIVTSKELNKVGGHVSSAWLLLVPVLNLYFVYRYAQSYAAIVKKDHSASETILYCLIILSPIIVVLLAQLIGLGSGLLYIFQTGIKHTYLATVPYIPKDPKTFNYYLTVYLLIKNILPYVLLTDVVVAAKVAILQTGFNDYRG